MLWQMDQTLNMLSMFSFVIALGIVVDDAIVIGENIYAHREMDKSFLQAAVDGTYEVLPSVAASITTTVFAFTPMFFVTGVMGKFFAVMPLAVIAMLIISLLESTLILPCHLAHGGEDEKRTLSLGGRILRSAIVGGMVHIVCLLVGTMLPSLRAATMAAALMTWGFVLLWIVLGDVMLAPFRRIHDFTDALNSRMSRGLEFMITRIYLPLLRRALRFPAITCAIAIAVLLSSFSLVMNGSVPWVIFPKTDARRIEAKVVFPDGTPSRITDAATQKLEDAILRVNERYQADGQPLVTVTYRLVGQVSSSAPGGADDRTEGGHAGTVQAALVESTERSISSLDIVDEWREEVGAIAGAETLSFGSMGMGPGGTPIEFKLLADGDHMDDLEAAVEECKEYLARQQGVIDISDDSQPGKWEFQITVKDDARSLGVPLQDLAGTVRAAYYGEEVMRLQRGRHEVKLMVRYPQQERRSLADFDEVRIDTGDGTKRPLAEVAHVNIERGYSEINRVNQKRSITVTADIDESGAKAADAPNAAQIVSEMSQSFMPELLERYPNVQVRWEGQQEQTVESMQSLFVGLGIALLATYVLLTMQFTSYIQPAIIMAVIPFGIIGALWGHALMGLPLTLFSVLGLVALTGVVVNDSIVLVDFTNARVNDGMPLEQALVESGRRRFRPVLLTSLTTVAGLAPILTEKSQQAQILIPMANSLCFGLLLATTLVLFLVPTFYSIYGRIIQSMTVGSPDLEAPLFEIDDSPQTISPVTSSEPATESDHSIESEPVSVV